MGTESANSAQINKSPWCCIVEVYERIVKEIQPAANLTPNVDKQLAKPTLSLLAHYADTISDYYQCQPAAKTVSKKQDFSVYQFSILMKEIISHMKEYNKSAVGMTKLAINIKQAKTAYKANQNFHSNVKEIRTNIQVHNSLSYQYAKDILPFFKLLQNLKDNLLPEENSKNKIFFRTAFLVRGQIKKFADRLANTCETQILFHETGSTLQRKPSTLRERLTDSLRKKIKQRKPIPYDFSALTLEEQKAYTKQKKKPLPNPPPPKKNIPQKPLPLTPQSFQQFLQQHKTRVALTIGLSTLATTGFSLAILLTGGAALPVFGLGLLLSQFYFSVGNSTAAISVALTFGATVGMLLASTASLITEKIMHHQQSNHKTFTPKTAHQPLIKKKTPAPQKVNQKKSWHLFWHNNQTVASQKTVENQKSTHRLD